MEIGRAFTTRRSKYADKTPTPSMPYRSASARHSGASVLRHKISAPIALLSTTNMLSYTAPNIRSSSSSSSSTSASSESEHSPISSHSSSTSVSLDSPPLSPQPNHLSVYFPPSGRLSSASGWSDKSQPSSDDAPPVPKRALSHTAKSHMMAHRRSQRRLSPTQQPPNSIDKITSDTNTTRSSRDMFSSNIDAPHPFGRELEQVNELAEEYGLQSNVIDQEELMMQERGLLKFGVEDYLMEITELYGGVFEDEMPLFAAGWI